MNPKAKPAPLPHSLDIFFANLRQDLNRAIAEGRITIPSPNYRVRGRPHNGTAAISERATR